MLDSKVTWMNLRLWSFGLFLWSKKSCGFELCKISHCAGRMSGPVWQLAAATRMILMVFNFHTQLQRPRTTNSKMQMKKLTDRPFFSMKNTAASCGKQMMPLFPETQNFRGLPLRKEKNWRKTLATWGKEREVMSRNDQVMCTFLG